jgi:16S rRNA (guanine966-N2)-methyltransferase
LEAVSRGAVEAIFLEQSKDALAVLRNNIDALGVAGKTRVIEGPVKKTIRRVDGNIIFLDPPYAAAEEYEQTLAALAASTTGALIVVEHAARMVLPVPVGLGLTRLKRQGDSALSFFVAKKILTG